MHALARFSILAFAALLTACASKAPPPRPPNRSYSVRRRILARRRRCCSVPSAWSARPTAGGNTPDSGFDCSGLINFVYRDMTGIKLPRSTREMISMRAPSVPVQALQTGDLVFFATSGGRTVSHAGIYVGEGRFVHAPRTGGTVRLDSLQNSYWQRAYLDAKRVLVAPSPLARMP